MKYIYIGVIGASQCDSIIYSQAVQVGEILAKRSAVIMCGGGYGIMEAVAYGAAKQNGTIIGILPGNNRNEGNKYLTYCLATGLGEARNAIIARASDALIAISGGYGTLSEIGLALKMRKTVVGLNTWNISSPYPKENNLLLTCETPEQAVHFALEAAQGRLNKWK